MKIGKVSKSYYKSQRVVVIFNDGSRGRYIAQSDITTQSVIVVGRYAFSNGGSAEKILTTDTILFSNKHNYIVEGGGIYLSLEIVNGQIITVYSQKTQIIGSASFSGFNAANIRLRNKTNIEVYALSDDLSTFIEYKPTGIGLPAALRTLEFDTDRYASQLSGDVGWAFIFPRVQPVEEPITGQAGDVSFISLEIDDQDFTYTTPENIFKFGGESLNGSLTLNSTTGEPGGYVQGTVNQVFSHNGAFVNTITSFLLGDGATINDSATIIWSNDLTENKDYYFEHSDDSISSDDINRPYYVNIQGSILKRNVTNNSTTLTYSGGVDQQRIPQGAAIIATYGVNGAENNTTTRQENSVAVSKVPVVLSNYYFELQIRDTRITSNSTQEHEFTYTASNYVETNSGGTNFAIETQKSGTSNSNFQKTTNSERISFQSRINLGHIGIYTQTDAIFIETETSNSTSSNFDVDAEGSPLENQPTPPEYTGYATYMAGNTRLRNPEESNSVRTTVRNISADSKLYKIIYNDRTTIPTENSTPEIEQTLIPGYAAFCKFNLGLAKRIDDFFKDPSLTPEDLRAYIGVITITLNSRYSQYLNLVNQRTTTITNNGSGNVISYGNTKTEINEDDIEAVELVGQSIIIKTQYQNSIYLTKCIITNKTFTNLPVTPGSTQRGDMHLVNGLNAEAIAAKKIDSFFTTQEYFFTEIGAAMLVNTNSIESAFRHRTNILKEQENVSGNLEKVIFAVTMLPLSQKNSQSLVFEWDTQKVIKYVGIVGAEVYNLENYPTSQAWTQLYTDTSEIKTF